MTKVNLKQKSRKGNYLLGSQAADRFQDENLREAFQEILNTKPESLKLDTVEDG